MNVITITLIRDNIYQMYFFKFVLIYISIYKSYVHSIYIYVCIVDYLATYLPVDIWVIKSLQLLCVFKLQWKRLFSVEENLAVVLMSLCKERFNITEWFALLVQLKWLNWSNI